MSIPCDFGVLPLQTKLLDFATPSQAKNHHPHLNNDEEEAHKDDVGEERDGDVRDHCRSPLHEECPKQYGHNEDFGVAPGTCGAVGERDQMILVWVKALGVGNASQPRRLGFTRVGP